MAIHSSILAWRIPWTEEPGRLQFNGVAKELDTTEWLTHTHTHTHTHNTTAQPTDSAYQPALGHDFSWFCSSLTSYPALDESTWTAALTPECMCLDTGALYCICHSHQQLNGLCRAAETMHSGGLCTVDSRPVTCLMKVVRRQICRFASPHSDTMSSWEQGLGDLVS